MLKSYECFTRATEHVLGASSDWMAKLIGFSCDGTNVYIAAGGLRGLLEEPLPWIVVLWCLTHHRLELDALKKTIFSSLMTCLCVYITFMKNLLKNVMSLKEVVKNLRMC